MRLDKHLALLGKFESRSKAEEAIKGGQVIVNKQMARKPSMLVSSADKIKVLASEQFVSRAALKLKSVADDLGLKFTGKTLLDIGSSTGGFSEFAIKQGAQRVYAVDVGTNQLHPKLRLEPKIELHEKTDIRDFVKANSVKLQGQIDMVLADVSFISLTKILPSVRGLCDTKTQLALMCKPQFEATPQDINKGVVKNSKIRRDILKNFEFWLSENGWSIINKADSKVAGAKGNVERFYLIGLA